MYFIIYKLWLKWKWHMFLLLLKCLSDTIAVIYTKWPVYKCSVLSTWLHRRLPDSGEDLQCIYGCVLVSFRWSAIGTEISLFRIYLFYNKGCDRNLIKWNFESLCWKWISFSNDSLAKHMSSTIRMQYLIGYLIVIAFSHTMVKL